jgi:hypothetical protein
MGPWQRGHLVSSPVLYFSYIVAISTSVNPEGRSSWSLLTAHHPWSEPSSCTEGATVADGDPTVPKPGKVIADILLL